MRVKRYLIAAAIGAGLVWFNDPVHGPARRRDASDLLERATSCARQVTHTATDRISNTTQMPPSPASLIDVIEAAKQNGFVADFTPTSDGRLTCGACEATSEPDRVPREWMHRLEGTSDPDELLTISALECPVCASKGLLVLPYGPAADAEEADISRRLQVPRRADMAPLGALRVAV